MRSFSASGIRALDEVGLVGAGGIDRRRGIGSGLLGAGHGVVNSAEESGQPAHGKLHLELAFLFLDDGTQLG